MTYEIITDKKGPYFFEAKSKDGRFGWMAGAEEYVTVAARYVPSCPEELRNQEGDAVVYLQYPPSWISEELLADARDFRSAVSELKYARKKEAQEKEIEEMRLEKEAREAEISLAGQGVEMRVLRQDAGTRGECGRDPMAEVEIRVDGGDPLRFEIRNVFDFGVVINPLYPLAAGLEPGGIPNGDMWLDLTDKGWVEVRKITPEEDRALRYLGLAGLVPTGIRM